MRDVFSSIVTSSPDSSYFIKNCIKIKLHTVSFTPTNIFTDFVLNRIKSQIGNKTMLLKETFRKVLIVTIVIVQTKTFIPTCRGTEISHYQKPIIELNRSSEHVSAGEQCNFPFTWELGDFSNNIVCLRFICVNSCGNMFMFMYTKHRRSVNYNYMYYICYFL